MQKQKRVRIIRQRLRRVKSAFSSVTPLLPRSYGTITRTSGRASREYHRGVGERSSRPVGEDALPLTPSGDARILTVRHASYASYPANMRTCGMIGGVGPESTIDYYRSIIARFRARMPDAGYPHLIINSLDVDKGIAMLDAGRLDELTNYLVTGVELLMRAGADFGFIAANTPHLVFNEVQLRCAIPLLSIVRATCDYAKTHGLRKAGLFGTGFTMRGHFYSEEFQRAGITLVRPTQSEQEFIHRKYIKELLKNRFLPESRTEILRIARRMKAEDGIEALILAGTELPLLLRDSKDAGIEFLDTTVIHVEAIVDELLA